MNYFLASKKINSYNPFNVQGIGPKLENLLNYINQFYSISDLKENLFNYGIISDMNIDLSIIMSKKVDENIKYYEIINENYFPLKNSPFIYNKNKLLDILENGKKDYSFMSFLYSYVITKRGYASRMKEKLEKMDMKSFYSLFLDIRKNNKRTVLNSLELNMFSDLDLIDFANGNFKELEKVKDKLITILLGYNNDLIYLFSKLNMGEINYHKTFNYFFSLLRFIEDKKYDEQVFNTKFNYIVNSIFKNEKGEFVFRNIFDFLKYYYVDKYDKYIDYLQEDNYNVEKNEDELSSYTY